ncbi:hypothetical protein [Pantoea ananatis]|uniref:hypothetical protein n=1 Tax=Pantoea ananas TaxID=553 RepID=UPI001B300ACE|nr:hypothetical protein [Pantoea ananatis]
MYNLEWDIIIAVADIRHNMSNLDDYFVNKGNEIFEFIYMYGSAEFHSFLMTLGKDDFDKVMIFLNTYYYHVKCIHDYIFVLTNS